MSDTRMPIENRDGRMGLTSSQVMARTGVSYRQLDYWCRTGRLGKHEEQGSGNWREFTVHQMNVVLYVMKLLDSFTLDKAFEIANQLANSSNGAYVESNGIYVLRVWPRTTAGVAS